MTSKVYFLAFVASLLAGAALAQAPPALNLKLPAAAVPAPSTSAATTAADPPGAYYGDTSGRMGNTVATTAPCDDSTYNAPEVHGSVGVGMMSGNHIGTGRFSTGNVNVTKRYGSCDDPSGSVNMSISVGDTHFNGRGRGH